MLRYMVYGIYDWEDAGIPLRGLLGVNFVFMNARKKKNRRESWHLQNLKIREEKEKRKRKQ